MHRDAIVMAILALVGVPASATVVGVGIALFIAGAAIQYDKVIATYQRGCVDQGDYLAGKLFGNVGLAIVGFASAFSASRQAAAAAAAEAEVASAIRNVNVKAGAENCVSCAVAADSTLGGAPASALGGEARMVTELELFYGGTFQSVSGPAQIASILSQSGNGARGIVYGASTTPGRMGHVFNAVNKGGTIVFADGQKGLTGLGTFANLKNFHFSLTASPGK